MSGWSEPFSNYDSSSVLSVFKEIPRKPFYLGKSMKRVKAPHPGVSINGIDKISSLMMAKKKQVARTMLELEKTSGLTSDVILPKIYSEIKTITGKSADGVKRMRSESEDKLRLLGSTQVPDGDDEEIAAMPRAGLFATPKSIIESVFKV